MPTGDTAGDRLSVLWHFRVSFSWRIAQRH